MKHSTLSSCASGIVTAMILFLITMSVSFAQTEDSPRPSVADVNNVKSTRFQTTPKPPVPTLYNERGSYNKEAQKKKVDDIKARIRAMQTQTKAGYGTTTEARSFLDKARNTLQEKRGIEKPQDKREFLEGRKAKLEEQKKERVSRFLNNIKRKMVAATARIEKLLERIESRVAKFEERGVDMTEAHPFIGAAKEDIESAKESIRVAFENAEVELATSTSREAFGGVVNELTKAKESLRAAHKSLVEIIRIMKANLPNNPTDNQTDTATTTDTGGETN